MFTFFFKSQKKRPGGAGALQDGRVPVCIDGDRLRHEAAALASGRGAGLRQRSPVHRQAQRGLHEAAADIQRDPERQVGPRAADGLTHGFSCLCVCLLKSLTV